MNFQVTYKGERFVATAIDIDLDKREILIDCLNDKELIIEFDELGSTKRWLWNQVQVLPIPVEHTGDKEPDDDPGQRG